MENLGDSGGDSGFLRPNEHEWMYTRVSRGGGNVCEHMHVWAYVCISQSQNVFISQTEAHSDVHLSCCYWRLSRLFSPPSIRLWGTAQFGAVLTFLAYGQHIVK